MRKVFAACVCVLFMSVAQAVSPTGSTRQQIEPLLDEMTSAANAHDTDRYLVPYLHEPSLIFVINGTLIHGWKDLHDQQLKWWNNGASDAVYTLRGTPEFTVLSPKVVVVTKPLASRRTSSDGSVRSSEFVLTMVWQKLAQGWRIVVAHESTVH